ncbi:nucleotide exchange factor GrpE [Mameliella sediminis]|uniref:nucleotide exchange factor GrpE n=1 Tax=Mameliella sediminis TaxID=2836866 RepID=UPI001C494F3C|nr:nucleotide exchange factor GrpE [Mameliella sediminis]MBY6114006.1 nucleotide exchange factor GrpE [Antarctobacter heliothermus]MBY6142646.1 nucleotide exchange factor GrpE [Mameliella alba]MBV7395303.1 nucleotide exchange factor GrpE [Mameliella sediminis]MBY6159501.1 nucleotide exchange factor GrpE [Mameliella alba]MBY6167972.1 nucleotide exchange factor GrpE [Mameliella alba]
MADPKKDDFLDDIETAEAEEQAELTGEIDDIAMEIDTLRAERDDFKDKFMRALADAENARKRADKDRREAQAYGGTRIARDLLPVYDNLNRALAAAQEEGSQASTALVEGVELTLKELLKVFERHGVTRITPEVGDRFDPQQHEAMFEAPVPGTKAGDIIQVSAEGFLLYDRLLRPAQVGVSSMPAS